MVVENINQLKMLLAELTEKHQKRLIRVSRIKEVNNERKHYIKNNKYCVVNNTYEPQSTVVYRGDGSSFRAELDANEIIWYEIG